VGSLPEVASVTDVTGFGLLGHLSELCEGSDVSARVDFDSVPLIEGLGRYLELGTFPGGTDRNFESYGHHIGTLTDRQKMILCDPQTSGGLLIAVEPKGRDAFLALAESRGLKLSPFGVLTERGDKLIEVV
jgi:selenide,water dikinase